MSLGRLESLIKHLEKDPDLLQKYNIIQEQFAKGIIKRAESSEEDHENRKRCIPHHAVIAPEKTTAKVRIVYDASTKIKRSLRGFQEFSDTEKASLQVELNDTD